MKNIEARLFLRYWNNRLQTYNTIKDPDEVTPLQLIVHGFRTLKVIYLCQTNTLPNHTKRKWLLMADTVFLKLELYILTSHSLALGFGFSILETVLAFSAAF